MFSEATRFDATPSHELEDAAVLAFVQLAIADPQWADEVAARGVVGGLPHLLTGSRLTYVISHLHLPSVTDEGMLRARILSGVASARRCDTCDKLEADDLARRAWNEAPSRARRQGAAWDAIALGENVVVGPAAVADYPRYRELAAKRIESLTLAFDRALFLGDAILVAGEHQDWPTFERWLGLWRSLPEPVTRNNTGCAIVNVEGLRALDEGRLADAEAAMKELLDLAPTTPFLSGTRTSALQKRLRSERRMLKLCDSFDTLVRRSNWFAVVTAQGSPSGR